MIYKDELNEDRLKVFRDFEINKDLPKYDNERHIYGDTAKENPSALALG